MNTNRVNAAAGVLHAAMQQGKSLPQSLAYGLEAAGLLQSPESAAELVQLRERLTELEAELRTVVAARDAQIIAWLGKKAREFGYSNAEKRAKADAVALMADKLIRGAVRPLEDPHDSPLHHDYRVGRELPEISKPRPDCPLGGQHMPGVSCDELCDEKAAALEELHAFLRGSGVSRG